MKLILLLTIVACTLNFKVYAQLDEVCGIMAPQDSTSWGIGAIRWEDQKSIKAFNEKKDTVYTISPFTIRLDNTTTIPVERNDVVFALHYGNIFLKVFEVKNTMYKVLVNSINGGLWISFDELNAKGLTFNTYYSILYNDYLKGSLNSLGVNLFKSCLNLREEPFTNSKIVKCLSKNVSGEKFHRISIQYFRESWASIIVQEYIAIPDNGDFGEGCAFMVINEYHGWSKIIDENGYPNFWYSMTKY
jgi:hypothetical protein